MEKILTSNSEWEFKKKTGQQFVREFLKRISHLMALLQFRPSSCIRLCETALWHKSHGLYLHPDHFRLIFQLLQHSRFIAYQRRRDPSASALLLLLCAWHHNHLERRFFASDSSTIFSCLIPFFIHPLICDAALFLSLWLSPHTLHYSQFLRSSNTQKAQIWLFHFHIST